MNIWSNVDGSLYERDDVGYDSKVGRGGDSGVGYNASMNFNKLHVSQPCKNK